MARPWPVSAFGVIRVRSSRGQKTSSRTLVPQMASAVHRARLDREARLDPLTGVPVRRILDSSLHRAFRRSCDEGTSMAVIMCDVDHFKQVNDTYGHAAGDEALKLVARTLDTERRETDLCCRYGGEEFTVLLENTSGEAALQLAERLRLGSPEDRPGVRRPRDSVGDVRWRCGVPRVTHQDRRRAATAGRRGALRSQAARTGTGACSTSAVALSGRPQGPSRAVTRQGRSCRASSVSGRGARPGCSLEEKKL